MAAHGVGILGEGQYSSVSHRRIYFTWSTMLFRCYVKKVQDKQQSYIGCTVDERWHNFQNFCHDYLAMNGSNLNWQLDKDILIKDNKIYSKDTCVLLPQELNCIMTCYKSKNNNLPIGVSWSNRTKSPYRALCYINKKNKSLGHFPTIELAFLAYKNAKEAEIKRVTRMYKKNLDSRVYIVLMNYEVHDKTCKNSTKTTC
jgi:hypothetical protein